jgi:geranylgeranyl reductase family protein
MYDIVIIGAGPAGSKTAELLAKKNINVLLIEEHQDIGKPVQCTGINSHRLFNLSGVSKKIVVNKVRKARIYSSNTDYIELKSKKPVYVINRQKFDAELFKKAKKAGCKIELSTRFEGYKKKSDCLIVKTSQGNFKTKLLVGADGPNSTVAKSARIKLPENMIIGYQETINNDFKNNVVELWFDSNITPDFFAWVVPENKDWARVGLACKRNTIKYFGKFIKNRFGQKYEKKDVLGGVIRFGLIEDSVEDRVLLVGDAASMVKPLTGGGVIYGQIGARIATEACLKCLKEDKFGHEFLKEVYDREWKDKLAWPIKSGLILYKLSHVPNWLFNISIDLAKPFTPIINNLDMDFL